MEQVLRERIGRVRAEVMAPLELDLLLAYTDDPFDPGAVRYLTDFDTYAMYALAVVPRQGDVALAFGLHHSAYLVRVKDTAVADYFCGTYAPGTLCGALLAAASDGSEAGARIGLVGGRGMLHRIDGDLRRHLPGASLMDVDDTFWRSAYGTDRDNAAVANLRRSAAMARDSLTAAAAYLNGRLTTRDIAAEIGLRARRRGADVLNREMVRTSFAVGRPLPDRLAPPGSRIATDVIAIAVSLAYRGARTVYGRTVLSPERSDPSLSQRLIEAEAAHREICALARAGKSADDFAGAATAVATRSGGVLAETADFGHATGLSQLEEPRLRHGRTTELIAGMTLAVRTRFRIGALGTAHLSDTVMITSEAAQVLTA